MRFASHYLATRWPALIEDRFGQFAASWFDQGQALWPSPHERGAYAEWRALALHDLTPEVAGFKGFAANIARQLASGLRLARSEAVAQRRETFLVIDLAGRRFKVDRDAREYPLPKNIELKLYTAQKDLVDEKTGSIRFYPDGGSNGGRITLGAGERKYEVDVDWLTGRVAILD